jgi:hypothetical protein
MQSSYVQQTWSFGMRPPCSIITSMEAVDRTFRDVRESDRPFWWPHCRLIVYNEVLLDEIVDNVA